MAEDQPVEDQLEELWSGPVQLGDNPFETDWGGLTFDFSITVWDGALDGSGTATLIVETDNGPQDRAKVPVTVRYCPMKDGVVSPPIVLLSEVLETDGNGRLHVPLNFADLASRPLYFMAVRIEAIPLGPGFTVRRLLGPQVIGGPGMGIGFHE